MTNLNLYKIPYENSDVLENNNLKITYDGITYFYSDSLNIGEKITINDEIPLFVKTWAGAIYGHKQREKQLETIYDIEEELMQAFKNQCEAILNYKQKRGVVNNGT